jgi:signal transduction histidine kinase
VQLRCLGKLAGANRVLDTGVSIPGDQLAHIFDEFCRSPSSQCHEDGYGLGLSIVDRLVRLS